MTRRNNGSLKVGSEHKVIIEKMAHEGQGIGKICGVTVLLKVQLLEKRVL